MPLEQLLSQQRDEINRIAARHGADQVRVFGSVARGESRPDSDVDLLVSAGPHTSPWFPAGLIIDLETLLGCHVDVVTEAGLRPDLRESVLKDARPI
jgi:uncharacterized protein